MTRLVVGPFNRVEGDLEVKLDIADGRVETARVNSPLYRGFERILIGKPPADALVYAPRICGICSVSQSVAAAKALAEAQGVVMPPNGELAVDLVHATENVADHLTHFYLFFMPDFARDVYRDEPWHMAAHERFVAMKGTASQDILPARAQFMHLMGILAGKWPHTLSVQPGGSTRAVSSGRGRANGGDPVIVQAVPRKNVIRRQPGTDRGRFPPYRTLRRGHPKNRPNPATSGVSFHCRKSLA